nr:hypothetical protein [Kibdelosporangium sp. MJ126-NF4]CTQ91335.1 hypothetical protein [Kibdelosporangium sp. MJ126-NF4]
MMVAQLPDPVMPGNSITLAWDKDRSPDSLLYAHRKSTDPDKGEGLAVELQMSKPQAPPGAASPDVRSGSGYEAAFQITNLIRGDEGCSTGWFAPTYTADRDHKIVSCYEVLELDKTPIFIYNRWSPVDSGRPLLLPVHQRQDIGLRRAVPAVEGQGEPDLPARNRCTSMWRASTSGLTP